MSATQRNPPACRVAQVMQEVRNYFPHYRVDGPWEVRKGELIGLDLLLTGDWVAIGGSRNNDGVYQVAEDGHIDGLQDECWEGTLWLLRVPKRFLALCSEIDAWCEEHPSDDVKRESFGAYSAEFATDSMGLPIGWQHVFGAALRPWRRMYTEVNV